MTSTMSQPQSLSHANVADNRPTDRPDKRRYPDSTPSENGEHHSDEEDAFDDDQDKQSVQSHDTRDSTSQPPTKTRKKPGRKPNPASPAVRKEQNRAAQRAFRDRKERHLQQLENMIKELKETHHNATLRFQRESQQLKGIIESLQSENYYLREVVFSFESALGKTGNSAILQDVKAELYRRHYENHAARKVSFATPQDPQPSPSTTSMSADSPATAPMSVPNSVQDAISQAAQVQMLNQALAAAAAANASLNLQNHASTSTSTSTSTQSWNQMGLEDPQDDNLFSMNSEILYKAPILPSTSSDSGKTTSSSSSSPSSSSSTTTFDPLAAARAATFNPNGPWLPKTTEYTNKPTVFDELQSSLFPAGTLQSVASSSMATPQEIVNDISLFDQLQESRSSTDASFSPNQNMFSFTAASMDSAFPNQTPTFLDSDDVDNEFSMITPNLGFDDGLKQEIIPSHRLQMEIRILASATPAADPSIDPKIYELPHDSRIDLIPCPKLRAQMILHQHEYDIEDLCQLLIGGAICHGHPLDPHNWELPRAFFDRYGYLMGAELMRYKYKVWPKKSPAQRHADMFRTL